MSNSHINDLLESLKDEFVDTVHERLSSIEEIIFSLTSDGDVENLLRIVHSLKGAASTHGFHIYTKICHQMEDAMLVLIENKTINTQTAIDTLLIYNDLNNTALDIISNGDDNFSVINNKLNTIANSTKSEQRNVLIVEPSDLYASMIESVIENKNFKMKRVSDGFLALENLLMQQYDIVITAMELPVLNGDALISALRISKRKNSNITAILVTTKDKSKIKHAKLFDHIINRNVISDGSLVSLMS